MISPVFATASLSNVALLIAALLVILFILVLTFISDRKSVV